MASLANLEMNRTWTTNTAGKLAQQEFYNQRMHREPVHIAPPNVDGPDRMRSMHRTSFKETNEIPIPSNVGARYTVGTKNALGTHVNYKQVSLDELRVGRVELGGTDRSWSTNFNDAFRQPDLQHPTQGLKAPRSGKAPRMPFSEVERRFGSLDSTGTMPGKEGVTEGTSENRAAYADPGRQPKIEPHLTLGYGNDIGSCVSYQQTPTILADMTHYSLGNIKTSYVTTAMDSTKPPPRAAAGQRPGNQMPAAGQVPPVGPSEVEQGFRQQFNSQVRHARCPSRPHLPRALDLPSLPPLPSAQASSPPASPPAPSRPPPRPFTPRPCSRSISTLSTAARGCMAP